jgi:hypothetical protein
MAGAEAAISRTEAVWLPQRMRQLDAAITHPKDAFVFSAI